MKQYFPDIQFNKAKRTKAFIFVALAVILLGGMAVTFFIMGQTLIAICVALFVVIALSTIPSTISSYPTKNEPLIEVDGTKLKLYNKEEYKTSDIVAVSVVIEVPRDGKTKEEQIANLKKIACIKPQEEVFGTCDIIIKNKEGKEDTRYNYICDALGCLKDLISGGVTKYRIVYTDGKNAEPCHYNFGEVEQKNSQLDEKEKLMQLL